MTYEEEIYERAELQFGSLEAMQSWLQGFEGRVQNKYTEDGKKVSDDVTKSIGLINIIDSIKSVDEFKPITPITVTFGKEEVQTKITDKKTELESEAKDLIRTTGSEDEFERAVDNLRVLNPSSLGGLKSGATRRVPKAFRLIFGDLNEV